MSAVIVPVIFVCIAMLFAMAAIDESSKILNIYALLCNTGYYLVMLCWTDFIIIQFITVTYSRKLTPDMFPPPLYTVSAQMKHPSIESKKALNSLYTSGIGNTCIKSNRNCTKPYRG